MKNLFKFTLLIVAICFMFLSPVATVVQAQGTLVDETETSGGLVPCGNKKVPITSETTKNGTAATIVNPCDFDYFLYMINLVIDFILFKLAIPLSAIAFAYAGFILLFSGGQAGKRTQAKNIFLNVAIGLILAASCWLIVNTILSVLGYDGTWIGFKK